VKELFQLIAFGRLDYLFKRHKIRSDSSYCAVEQTGSPRIARKVPHVDGKDEMCIRDSSQTGLVVHWWRTRPARWRRRAVINGGGAVVTGIATIIFLISKFEQGAWIVVIAVPAFVLLFVRCLLYTSRCV